MTNPDRAPRKIADGGDAAGRPAPAGGRRVLGLRLVAFLELALFMAAALLIDQLFGAGDRFRSMAPHPFWIIVLLLSVQYGTFEGLMAAAVGSAVLLIDNLPPQALGVDRFDYLFEVGLQPMAWFVAAVMLGELANRHRRRVVELDRALRDSEERERRLTHSLSGLKAAHEKLELSLASELHTELAIHRAAGHLHGDSIEAILTGAAGLLEAAMQPVKYSLYLLDRGKLQLEAREGWAEDETFRADFDGAHPLFEAVVVRRRVLCLASEEDAEVLGQEGFLAGPLFDEGQRQVLGMLKIEKMNFVDLTFGAIENFKAISELVGAALDKLQRMTRLEAQNIFDTRTMLYSEAFYERQAAFLVALGQRVGFPVSRLRIRLTNAADLSDDQLRRLPVAIRDGAVQSLRSTDLVFRQSGVEHGYTVVLPNTESSYASLVADQLQRAIRAKLGTDEAQLECVGDALVSAPDTPGTDAGYYTGADAYAQQFRFLLALARRVGFDICQIRISMDLDRALPADVKRELPDRVMEIVRVALPAPNLAYRETDSPTELVILVPAAGIEGARHLSERLVGLLEDRFGAAYAALGLRTTVDLIHEGRPAGPAAAERDPALAGEAVRR